VRREDFALRDDVQRERLLYQRERALASRLRNLLASEEEEILSRTQAASDSENASAPLPAIVASVSVITMDSTSSPEASESCYATLPVADSSDTVQIPASESSDTVADSIASQIFASVQPDPESATTSSGLDTIEATGVISKGVPDSSPALLSNQCPSAPAQAAECIMCPTDSILDDSFVAATAPTIQEVAANLNLTATDSVCAQVSEALEVLLDAVAADPAAIGSTFVPLATAEDQGATASNAPY
jgi:hypothetical protein